jgi:CMP-N,N'-diacetyllegionaminic acid synthase
MKNNWKILGLITARGGSKGLPGKNIKPLLGKPLINWSIDAASGAPSLDSVVVSTDDNEIAQIARASGARVPFIRPAHLASDTSTSVDTVLHALDYLETLGERYDVVVLLEPTSPLRDSVDIEEALELMGTLNSGAVVSVCRAESVHPAFMYRRESDGRLRPFLGLQPTALRRQEIEPLYFLEGTIYASRVDVLRKNHSFYHEDTIGYEVPRWKSLEIDGLGDFLMVEALLKYKGQQK